jgi:hypothetical protein
MRRIARSVAVALAAIGLFGLGPSRAGLDAAKEAFSAGAYGKARQDLQSPDTWDDPDALAMLATAFRDGWGGPQDLVEAYKLDTLVFMLGSPDQRASIVGERRMVARKLSQDQIREAEHRVVAWVDERSGREERERRVDDLKVQLSSCAAKGLLADACFPLGGQVLQFGPAAASLIPALEALMTRDGHWMNRELYAAGLASIGTQAVPALARIMLDQQQLQTEGPWNTTHAMSALGWIGPGATAALPDLQLVFTQAPVAIGTDNGFLTTMGASADAMAFEIRLDAGFAILKVRDPQRTIEGPLKAALAAEKDPRFQLIDAWVIGLLYAEPQDGLRRAAAALLSPNVEQRRISLFAIADLALVPGAAASAADVIPALKRLSTAKDPQVATEAKASLERVATPWAADAVRALRSGRGKDAIHAIDRYIGAVPWQDLGYLVRAQAHRETGQIDKAVADYAKAAQVSGMADWLQGSMINAGLLKGEPSGKFDPVTRRMLPECLKTESCFAAIKDKVAPRFDQVLKIMGDG